LEAVEVDLLPLYLAEVEEVTVEAIESIIYFVTGVDVWTSVAFVPEIDMF